MSSGHKSCLSDGRAKSHMSKEGSGVDVNSAGVTVAQSGCGCQLGGVSVASDPK